MIRLGVLNFMSIQKKVDEVIDRAAGAGTSDKLMGKADQAIGKVKETVGDLIDNPKLEAKGVVQQAKGHAEEAKGEAMSTGQLIVEVVKEGAYIVGDKVHDVAESVKHMMHRDHKSEPNS